MAKLKSNVLNSNTFVYCKTKKEAKKLLKAAKKDLSLSLLHERSCAVMTYEPDDNFWKNFKKDCYYNLYYRKKAAKSLVKSFGGNIVKCDKAFKKKKKN